MYTLFTTGHLPTRVSLLQVIWGWNIRCITQPVLAEHAPDLLVILQRLREAGPTGDLFGFNSRFISYLGVGGKSSFFIFHASTLS